MMDSGFALNQAPGDEEDAWFLRRAGRGDERALAWLYERHGAVARRRAARALCDSALVEDAVHDGFVDLWRNANEFDSRRTTVQAWICVLVHRRAAGLARTEAQRRIRDGQAYEPHWSSLVAEELALLRDDRCRVEDAIAALKAPQKRVVDLAAYRGLIRSQPVVPPRTAKTRTRRPPTRAAGAIRPGAA